MVVTASVFAIVVRTMQLNFEPLVHTIWSWDWLVEDEFRNSGCEALRVSFFFFQMKGGTSNIGQHYLSALDR